jgi:hypothetical protein
MYLHLFFTLHFSLITYFMNMTILLYSIILSDIWPEPAFIVLLRGVKSALKLG